MKTYQNMAELVRDVSSDPETGGRLARDLNDQAIVHYLYGMRSAKRVSQSEMAAKLKCSQSRISKLESGLDDDLSIGDLRKYVRTLDHDLMFVIHKRQWTPADLLGYMQAMQAMQAMLLMINCAGYAGTGIDSWKSLTPLP